jgi:hypothetical protein
MALGFNRLVPRQTITIDGTEYEDSVVVEQIVRKATPC